MDMSKAVLKLTDFGGAGIIYGRRFNGGTDALLDRVPCAPGIYALFKDIVLNTDSPDAFFDDLRREMHSKKFADRDGVINPLYQITLTSKTVVPKAKLDRIRELSELESFRTSVAAALRLSLIFQAPLYVGKANDLRARLRQHFDPSSALSLRLSSSGIQIQQTTIVLLPIISEEADIEPNSTKATGQEDSEDDAVDEVNQALIFEEIFSRMFSPLFTIRYG